jgi:hypothetical protein
MSESPPFDVSSLSEGELRQIQNDILRALAEKAKLGTGPSERYDRHGSGHSKNTVQRVIRTEIS